MWTNIGKHMVVAVAINMGILVWNTSALAETPVNSEQLKTHLQIFDKIAKGSGGSRAIGTEGGQISGQYIDDYIDLPEVNLIGLPFETASGLKGNNILVTVPGKLDKDIIMIGTHYDSAQGRAGLNDNASGVAVLLELIQYYAKPANKPKHSLIFIFWDGHHVGLAGSKAHAVELLNLEMGTVRAYIHLDQVSTKQPTVHLAENPNQPQEKEQWMQTNLRDFFQSKGHAVKSNPALLAQTDAFAYIGKIPITAFRFTNASLSNLVTCQAKQCDDMSEVDVDAMQLAAEAVQNLIRQIDATWK